MAKLNATLMLLAGWLLLCSRAPRAIYEQITAVCPPISGDGTEAIVWATVIVSMTIVTLEGLALVWRRP
jgi:hypothetical protein